MENETVKALWEVLGLIDGKIKESNQSYETLAKTWSMDEMRLLSAKIDAYNECKMEIMKIFPKYADFMKK